MRYTVLIMKIYATVFLLTLFLLPLLVSAAPVIRTGENVSLKEDQAISGDFYVLGGSVTNSAAVSGDTYVAAGTLTQNGPIAADLAVVAGRVEVHASIGDDVRVLGGKVVLADKVAGDVVVLGGELTILSTAEVAGDVLFYGGSLIVEGVVKGSVLAKAETVRIDAVIGKDVDATAKQELVLGARANVSGAVTYRSGRDVIRAVDSHVGSISRDESMLFTEDTVKPSLFPILLLLFAGLVARFMLPVWLVQFFTRVNTSFGFAAFAGFAGLILIPIAVALTFVSVLGIFVGISLLFFYLFLLSVSIALSGMFLGGFISKYATGSASYSILWIFLGTTILYLLTFVPFVGGLITTLAVLTVFGGLLIRMYERYR